MKHIMYDPVPRIYELSWQGETDSIELMINLQVLKEVFEDPKVEDWPILPHLQEKYGLGEITADTEIGFGFDPCRLLRRGSQGDFAVFAMHLPQIEFEAGACRECKGKKRSKWDKCLYCGGSRKTYEFQHKLGTIATLNLSLLLMKLSFPELRRIETAHKQLMTVEVVVADRAMHGYPLWGAVSPEMARWIGECDVQTDLPLVRSAMEKAMVRMVPSMGVRKIFASEFQAWIEPEGVFHFKVPGNCACLSPDYTARTCLKENCGYDFGSHNVDGPAQQLPLLVGLISLWEMARKSLYKANT